MAIDFHNAVLSFVNYSGHDAASYGLCPFIAKLCSAEKPGEGQAE
jgi:hypothetical protein